MCSIFFHVVMYYVRIHGNISFLLLLLFLWSKLLLSQIWGTSGSLPAQCLISQETICLANSSLSCIEPSMNLPMVNLLSYPITDTYILVLELRLFLAVLNFLPKWLIIFLSPFCHYFPLAKVASYPYKGFQRKNEAIKWMIIYMELICWCLIDSS